METGLLIILLCYTGFAIAWLASIVIDTRRQRKRDRIQEKLRHGPLIELADQFDQQAVQKVVEETVQLSLLKGLTDQIGELSRHYVQDKFKEPAMRVALARIFDRYLEQALEQLQQQSGRRPEQ